MCFAEIISIKFRIVDLGLYHHQLSKTFKNYLASTTAHLYLFYAYNEAVELSEKFSALSAVRHEAVRKDIFLQFCNLFYDTYMAIGATYRLKLSDATLSEVVRRFSLKDCVEQEVCVLLSLSSVTFH